MDYIKYRFFSFLSVALISLVFAFQFFIEKLPLDSVIYGFSISFFVIFIIVIIDFFRYKKEMKRLKWSLDNINSIDFSDFNEKNIKDKIIIKQNEIIKSQITLNNKNKSEQIDFYTQWVHQIKTPIFALKLLLKDADNNEVTTEISKIEGYTEMVLNYVKLGESVTELELKQINLKPILNRVIKSYSSVFISKKLQLICNIEDKMVITDEKWLSFALSQIISNAVKYTEKGSVTITLLKDNLTISDTGVGINSSDLPRIFEKGFTGTLGRKNLNATGLGLYLTKKSLDLLDIDIKVTSKENAGTSFILIFPKNTNLTKM